MADIIDPGDDTMGFSNAMFKSLACGNDECWTRRRGEAEEVVISLAAKNHACKKVFLVNGGELVGLYGMLVLARPALRPDGALSKPPQELWVLGAQLATAPLMRKARRGRWAFARLRVCGLGRDSGRGGGGGLPMDAHDGTANRRREVGFWMRQAGIKALLS